MPIEGKIIPMADAARVAELDSVVGCDFDVAQISKLRSTDSDCQLVQPPAACAGDHSRTGGSKMTTPDQNRFASMVRMLQTAYPNTWERHLHNLGVAASADLPPAELERVMGRVFWMVPQAGIKNPAAWIASDMARVERASASVEPEAPRKVALDVAVRQIPVELKPAKLGTDLAKTSGAPPLASETGIKDPAARIATDTAPARAASASVEPEAPRKVAPPAAVRQNPVLKPVKLRVDPAKTSGAPPLASETGIKNPAVSIATDMARVTAPLASEARIKDPAARIAINMARVTAPSAALKPKARPKVARPVAIRQNPVEPKPVKLRTDRAKMFDLSLLELETASEIAAQELNWAKLKIENGERREAADHMYNAHDLYYATEQEIAAAVGRSQGWVSCMIRWRREGFKDETPFGPASKDARFAARIGRGMAQKPPRGLVRRWMRGTHPEDDAHASVSSGVLVIGAIQPKCRELPVADIKRSENT